MHETNELRSILNQELLPLLEQLDEFERQMPRARSGAAAVSESSELPALAAIARQRDQIDDCVKALMQQLYPSAVEGADASEADEALRRILGVSQRIQETASTILHRYEQPDDGTS